MITQIVGKPGAGKTSLLTHFLMEMFFSRGDELLERCREAIELENQERMHPLSFPEKPPIFANYNVSFFEGYEKTYSPYFLNPYYFGINHNETPVQYILPGSKIFIEESQRYYDSRQSGSFPRWVSEAFEMHRHFDLDIYLDSQRWKLIDLNIRDLVSRTLLVTRMENELNGYGGVLSTTWYLREFEGSAELTQYFETGVGGTEIDPVIHKGNIFEAFDSHKNRKAFYPPDKPAQGFTLLNFCGDKGDIPEELKMYYDIGEPKWFRHKDKETA